MNHYFPNPRSIPTSPKLWLVFPHLVGPRRIHFLEESLFHPIGVEKAVAVLGVTSEHDACFYTFVFVEQPPTRHGPDLVLGLTDCSHRLDCFIRWMITPSDQGAVSRSSAEWPFLFLQLGKYCLAEVFLLSSSGKTYFIDQEIQHVRVCGWIRFSCSSAGSRQWTSRKKIVENSGGRSCILKTPISSTIVVLECWPSVTLLPEPGLNTIKQNNE